VQDEAVQKGETGRARRPDVPSTRPAFSEAGSPAAELEARIAELTTALTATRERETDFRQAAFDLNAELLRKDAEIQHVREHFERTAARVAELEGLMGTRAVRAATFWWRVKAALRGR